MRLADSSFTGQSSELLVFTVDHTIESGNDLLFFVGDQNIIGPEPFRLAYLGCRGIESACGFSLQKGDIDIDCQRQLSMAVGGHGKGQVGKGEDSSSLDDICSIEMSFLNFEFCLAVAFPSFNDFNTG